MERVYMQIFPGAPWLDGALGGEERKLWEAVNTKMDGTPFEWPDDSWWAPIFSFDKPPIHGGKDTSFPGRPVLQALGLEAPQNFPLIPHSPDIHRVIEHTHARLVGEFNDWLYHNPSNKITTKEYKEKLVELFYGSPTVARSEVITKDVFGLVFCFKDIVARDGNWALACFR